MNIVRSGTENQDSQPAAKATSTAQPRQSRRTSAIQPAHSTAGTKAHHSAGVPTSSTVRTQACAPQPVGDGLLG